jgi:hypothetical protein
MTGPNPDNVTETTAAPKSAAAQELNTLSVIMRHTAKLSRSGKIWLREELDRDIEETS